MTKNEFNDLTAKVGILFKRVFLPIINDPLIDKEGHLSNKAIWEANGEFFIYKEEKTKVKEMEHPTTLNLIAFPKYWVKTREGFIFLLNVTIKEQEDWEGTPNQVPPLVIEWLELKKIKK